MTLPATDVVADQAAAIRVMVVDDSAVVRGYIVRVLQAIPGIVVVATCSNGLTAVQQLAHRDIDVVVLDIEMPVMDGLTALGRMLAIRPNVQVIMASTLTQRNAAISIEAMTRGAADYVPKPSTAGISTHADFRRLLVEKVVSLGKRRSSHVPRPAPTAPRHDRAVQRLAPSIALRSVQPSRRRALVIGSSTGGPQALTALLSRLPASLSQPILIAQHMPATFTTVLAQHIARASGRPCSEAVDNGELSDGHIYLAPGGYHMEVVREGAGYRTRLTQAPPENFCRPSVNPLFRSAARAFGSDVCAVMLTGMGSDGLEGTRDLARAGAPVIAQDEASSVVWGMPGAIANAGLCSAVLPLDEIAAHLAANCAGARR